MNLVHYLTRKDEGSPHTALFWQMFYIDHAVVRLGNDKFIDLNKQDTIALYDLSRDKAESENLATAHSEKLHQLQEIREAWTS